MRPFITSAVALAYLLAFSTPIGAQHISGLFYAAPGGIDNAQCTQALPCTPQGAVLACHAMPAAETCTVKLADGVYLDPAINIYYYRFVNVIGNCGGPQSVVLRATQPNTTLIWVQDHAIGGVSCLVLDAPTATGVIGIAGRQHVTIDYAMLMFGALSTQIAMNEFSIASCVGPVWLTGNAQVHAGASNHSEINIGCPIVLTEPLTFGYFVNATGFSIIKASGSTYQGTATGIRCNVDYSLVYQPAQPFPGNLPGNC